MDSNLKKQYYYIQTTISLQDNINIYYNISNYQVNLVNKIVLLYNIKANNLQMLLFTCIHTKKINDKPLVGKKLQIKIHLLRSHKKTMDFPTFFQTTNTKKYTFS